MPMIDRRGGLFAAPMLRASGATATPVQAGGGATAASRDSLTRSGASAAAPRDPIPAPLAPTPPAATDATSRMTAAQAAAYGKLAESDRAAFDRVWKANNRLGQNSLAKLLEDGRLLSSKDLHGGRTLLANLDRLATEPLSGNLNRMMLLTDMLDQAQNPGAISQGARGTCTVTTIEYMLAKKSPSEYVRIVADLATGDGQVTLASGAQAHRVPDSTGSDDSGRTIPSRLFEAAMMDYGNGMFSYSNRTDKSGVGKYSVLPGGLQNGQVARVANAVLDEHYRADDAVPVIGEIPWTSVGGARLMRDLQGALGRSPDGIPIGLDWRADGERKLAGHEVLVTRIADGRVYFRNPWGNYQAPGSETDGKDGPRRRIEDANGLESMTTDEMRKRINGILVK